MRRYLLMAGLAVQVVLFLAVYQPLFAQSPSGAESIAFANRLYQTGRPGDAVLIYRQLVDQGYRNGLLFYNLGNAYLEQGDSGRAILNYLRSRRLSPRDPDVQANLEAARRRISDSDIPSGETSLFAQFIAVTQLWVSTNELSLASLGLWIFFITLSIVLLISGHNMLRRTVTFTMVIVGILLLTGAVALGGRIYVEDVRQEAVVVANSVDVLNGPGFQYTPQLTLRSGTEASLIVERGSWAKLSIVDRQVEGWVPARAVETVTIEE